MKYFLKWKFLVALETQLCYMIFFFSGNCLGRGHVLEDVFADTDMWEDVMLRIEMCSSGICLGKGHVMFC